MIMRQLYKRSEKFKKEQNSCVFGIDAAGCTYPHIVIVPNRSI